MAVIAVIVFTAGFFAIVSRGVIAVSRRRPTTGREGLVGAEGVARSELNLAGRVFVHGELWEAATTAGPIAAGQRVRVVGLKGLRLFVEPIVASKVLVESKT